MNVRHLTDHLIEVDTRAITSSQFDVAQSKVSDPQVRVGVKPGNARGEQMFSALLPNSDIDVWHL
jgi:hypothetical protein